MLFRSPGCPAFKDDGFGAWSSGVGECADGFGGGVVEAYEHFVEAVVSDVGHEIFDVGTWEAVERCEGEGGVFCYAGAVDLCIVIFEVSRLVGSRWTRTYEFSCSSTFGDCYFLCRALELGDWVVVLSVRFASGRSGVLTIKGLALDLDGISSL